MQSRSTKGHPSARHIGAIDEDEGSDRTYTCRTVSDSNAGTK
jgi:hypothetical protein